MVDERNRVIRQASRHEVHTRKLRHRAVHILSFNRAGELFLQKRSRWKDVHPGVWDSSAAGHLNAGDDYAETALREVREELGVDVPAVASVAHIEAGPMTGWEFVEVFRAEHEGPFRLPPAEIETGGFFPLHMIREWVRAAPRISRPGFWSASGGWILRPLRLHSHPGAPADTLLDGHLAARYFSRQFFVCRMARASEPAGKPLCRAAFSK